jgi:hypothetical protein
MTADPRDPELRLECLFDPDSMVTSAGHPQICAGRARGQPYLVALADQWVGNPPPQAPYRQLGRCVGGVLQAGERGQRDEPTACSRLQPMHHDAAVQGGPIQSVPGDFAEIPRPLRDDGGAPERVVTRVDRVEILLQHPPDPISIRMQRNILREHDGGRPWLRRSRRYLLAGRAADRAHATGFRGGPQVSHQHPSTYRASEENEHHHEQDPPASGDMLRHGGRLRP